MSDDDSLYDDALDTWGLQAQVDQAIEELAELIVALEGDDREAVIDELADVQVMVDQLAVAFDANAVDERVADKQERLRERIQDARAYTDGGQDIDTESEESAEDQTCPVCGQEYVHKREEPDGREINHVLRDDFRECRVNQGTINISRPDTVYVHRTDRVVSHVKRTEAQTETPSKLGLLLGGDD